MHRVSSSPRNICIRKFADVDVEIGGVHNAIIVADDEATALSQTVAAKIDS
jgi:hypothetical protein